MINKIGLFSVFFLISSITVVAQEVIYAITIDDSVKVLVSPSINAAFICKLPKYSIIVVIEISKNKESNENDTLDKSIHNFVKIRTNNIIGWVYGTYVYKFTYDLLNMSIVDRFYDVFGDKYTLYTINNYYNEEEPVDGAKYCGHKYYVTFCTEGFKNVKIVKLATDTAAKSSSKTISTFENNHLILMDYCSGGADFIKDVIVKDRKICLKFVGQYLDNTKTYDIIIEQDSNNDVIGTIANKKVTVF